MYSGRVFFAFDSQIPFVLLCDNVIQRPKAIEPGKRSMTLPVGVGSMFLLQRMIAFVVWASASCTMSYCCCQQ